MAKKIILGKKYVDDLHGYEGIAYAHIMYLTGCDRVILQKLVKDEVKEQVFDITQLTLVKEKAEPKHKKVITPSKKKTGGPNSIIPEKSIG
jgi:hypothetical protein